MNIVSVTRRALTATAPKTHAWEDVGIVGLIDLEPAAVADQRRKRAARADHRPPLAPALDVCGRRLGARGRVRQRKDHRPMIMFAPSPAPPASENAASLPGDADQHRRLGVSDHIEQRDLVRMIECPGFDRRSPLHKGC